MSMRTLIAAAVLVLVASPTFAATGTVIPHPYPQYFTSSGAPCASCKLFVYEAGSSTKTNSYSDAALGSANTNPIVLDSAGRAKIFLASASYKFVLTTSGDTDPPTSPIWTIDNVTSIPPNAVNVDVDGTAGEALSAGDVVYLSAGDGGRTAGRWYKADADLDYGSVSASSLGFTTAAISSGSAGTIRTAGRVTGLASLSVGSVYYISATAGAVTASAPTNARKVGMADTTTTLITSHWLPQAEVTATLAGIVGTGANTMAGVKSFNDHPQFEPGTSTGSYAQAHGRLSSNTTTTANSGACGPDNLMSYEIPANTFDANGRTVTVFGAGTGANDADNKNITFKFDGTSLGTSGVLTNDAASGWTVQARITREDATHAKVGLFFSYANTAVGAFTRTFYTRVTVADFTSARTFLVEATTCTDNNDIVQEILDVWVD